METGVQGILLNEFFLSTLYNEYILIFIHNTVIYFHSAIQFLDRKSFFGRIHNFSNNFFSQPKPWPSLKRREPLIYITNLNPRCAKKFSFR